MLPYAFDAYRTTVRTLTEVTPYYLIYGMEVVLLIDVKIPSLRVLIEAGLEDNEWVQAHYEQLNMIDAKRLEVICYAQLYQKRIVKAYNKKVWLKELQEGDLVLRKSLPIH